LKCYRAWHRGAMIIAYITEYTLFPFFIVQIGVCIVQLYIHIYHFHSMDKILERYERYSYAEKVLISAESETQVLTSVICLHLIHCCMCFPCNWTTLSLLIQTYAAILHVREKKKKCHSIRVKLGQNYDLSYYIELIVLNKHVGLVLNS